MHDELIKKLVEKNFNRIERDDRLLDIFPTETAEKGVELWERWDDHTVTIVRLRHPVSAKTVTAHEVDRATLEDWLLNNETKALTDLQQVETFPDENDIGE